MGLQKYRADKSKAQPDGAVVWHAEWFGGPTLAKIDKCRLNGLTGDMRATVYITGEPDTYFTYPAVCRLMGKTVKGYVADDGGNLVFEHCYYA